MSLNIFCKVPKPSQVSLWITRAGVWDGEFCVHLCIQVHSFSLMTHFWALSISRKLRNPWRHCNSGRLHRRAGSGREQSQQAQPHKQLKVVFYYPLFFRILLAPTTNGLMALCRDPWSFSPLDTHALFLSLPSSHSPSSQESFSSYPANSQVCQCWLPF